MVIQTLTGVIYEVTSQSWAVASIIVKYYLVAAAAYLYSNKGLTRESFTEKIIKDSRFVLTGIVGAGTLFFILNLSIEPLIRLFSELVALVYLGYLFWKY